MKVKYLLAGTPVAVLAVWAEAPAGNEAELKAELCAQFLIPIDGLR